MYLTVNFIKNLPLLVEKDVILGVYNRLSKMVYFVAIIKKYKQKDQQDYKSRGN